jgi:hypothetical protein
MAYGRSQEEDFRAPFDRNDDSGTFVGSLRTARKTLGAQAPVEVTRLLRRLRKDFDAIRTIDYFPGAASTDAEVAWEDFLALADTVLSSGEPHATERANPAEPPPTIPIVELHGFTGTVLLYKLD